jgi:glycosyltransferase involved in cell wall biosynthesis
MNFITDCFSSGLDGFKMQPVHEQRSPGVSAIIPLFNKRATIQRAIESIFLQKGVATEIIIVDDGSTDGSGEFVRDAYGDRVRLITQSNSGPGAARNHGAKCASTDKLAFLDADDEWRPGHLEAALQGLADHPEAAAYVCGYDAGDYRSVRPNQVSRLGKSGLLSLASDTSGPDLKSHVDAMHSSCVVVRAEAFWRYNGYFTRGGCRYGEDSFLWLNVLLHEPVVWDPKEGVAFHVEDSALGFATTHRTSARPISTNGYSLGVGLDPPMLAALGRVVKTYAKMDIENLVKSGAFRAAAALRRQHGLGGRWEPLKDRLRQIRRYLSLGS